MKILYFDCSMGAAGDMLMGALYELCPEKEAFLARLNAALAPLAEVSAQPDSKRGIRATHMRVSIGGAEEGEPGAEAHAHHSHATAARLRERIEALSLPEPVKEDARAVFDLVLQAESQVHGQPMDQIHLHEVGSIDALADVLGVCLLIHTLAPDRIGCSPIRVGSGTVRCAHGLLPVPAPATELLLRGLPLYAGDIPGEMCTPTGAALLRHFAGEFSPLPPMRVEALGQGSGTKDFETANLLRAFLGETGDAPEAEAPEQVLELRCNLDDMSPEDLAFAGEELLRLGALDVFTLPAGMKKGRQGVLLCCLCRVEQRQAMIRAIFRHTSTLGVRETLCRRHVLRRSGEIRQTPLGPVRFKTARGFGVEREKPEYEDLARIARESGLSMSQVRRRLGEGQEPGPGHDETTRPGDKL